MSLPPIPAQRGSEVIVSSTGPSAHEDMTIAETLESMRDPSQRRPGAQCFLTGTGQHHWISDEEVARFTADFGAQHPSDYQTAHGISWELRFFSGF